MQELLAGGCSYVEWFRPVSSAHRMLSAGESSTPETIVQPMDEMLCDSDKNDNRH